MTPEQKALTDDLRARTEAFLSSGGTITKLNYAGVPVDDEYGRPVHVPAWAEPQVETAKDWFERVTTKPFTADPPPPPRHFDVRLPKPAPPVITPKEKAALAEFLADVPPPVPATKAEICEHFRVPVDPIALADHTADMRPQQESYLIAQLRQIRREARHWQSVLSRLEAL